MDVGCNSYSLCTLARADAFARMGGLGFAAIELWSGHASYLHDDADPAAIRAEARAAGLEIRAYCIGGLSGLSRPLVESRVEGAFRFARALGVDLVTGIVDRDAVEAVDVLCVRHAVRFAIENHWYAQLARPEHYGAVLRKASPFVGVNLDTGHFTFLGCDLARAAEILGPRTLNVHLKAVRRPGRLELLGRRLRKEYRMPPAMPRPGDGLDRLVAGLAAVGYDGMLAVEHESEGGEAELASYRARAVELVARHAASTESSLEEIRA